MLYTNEENSRNYTLVNLVMWEHDSYEAELATHRVWRGGLRN